MYQIAVCDDESATCNEIEKCIAQWGNEKGIQMKINSFCSGEELCIFMEQKGKIETVFLDIELPDKNGIEIGNYIRNQMEDENLNIVYISSKESYALQLFQCRPIDFLVKPVSYTDVERVMNVIVKRDSMPTRFFECAFGKSKERIMLSRILYFQSENKKISIVLRSGEKKIIYGKLQEIIDKLPDETFWMVHKSYLVNSNYVESFNYETLKMINGDIINISKANRQTVQNRLLARVK